MTVKSKWAFKRLVDEMSSEQYERMIAALKKSEIRLPGWTDRLDPDPEGTLPAEAISANVALNDLVSAITLSRTTRRGDYYNDPKGGVWLLASDNQLRVCGSDDYAASFMDLPATVDVPGVVVVDAREIWQITEALRKGTVFSGRASARVALESHGDSHLRITVDGRSHRAKVLGRHSPTPLLPPIAVSSTQIPDGAAVRRGVLHVVPAIDLNAARGSTPTDLNYVGLRTSDGTLTFDAQHPYQAARASMPASGATDIEQLVHYRWIRDVVAAIGTEAIQIGHVPGVGEHGLLMIAGDRWAAWTSHVRPWRHRFAPESISNVTTITFLRDEVHRYLTDAKRLAEASWAGRNSTLVQLTVSEDALTISSLPDSESAHTGTVRVRGDSVNLGTARKVYVRIEALLDALRSFAKQNVALHFGETSVVYATTAGFQPRQHPPLLAAVPKASPAPIES